MITLKNTYFSNSVDEKFILELIELRELCSSQKSTNKD